MSDTARSYVGALRNRQDQQPPQVANQVGDNPSRLVRYRRSNAPCRKRVMAPPSTGKSWRVSSTCAFAHHSPPSTLIVNESTG